MIMLTRKLLITLILIFSVTFTGNLLAEDDSDQEKTSIGDFIQEDQFEQLQDLERLTSPEMLFASDFNDFPMYEEDLYKIKHHSTGKAFMLSLILPGSGQVYSGSKLKAAFFFGVEIFSWYQYIKSYNKGQDLEDEYRAFADQNWDPGQYRAWLIEEIGISNDTMPYAADSTFTHHLPDKKTQQLSLIHI